MEKMPYVMDVAIFIINYCNRNDLEITNMRVQKLLYFVQANSFIHRGKPFFKENIEAWAYGPVVREVYNELSRFVGWEIPTISKYQRLDKKENLYETVYYDENIFSEDDKNIMIEVIEAFKGDTTVSIVDLTHKQTPWKRSYIYGEKNIIKVEDIKEFFLKN